MHALLRDIGIAWAFELIADGDLELCALDVFEYKTSSPCYSD